MSGPSKADLIAKVEVAKQAINEAEKELAGALTAIDTSPRAEKKHMSDALRSAFTRLGVAQQELTALVQAVTDADDVLKG